jgi:hypothetical protein
LFLKDLQGTRFKESHVVLKFKPLISVAYEHKKGGEKFLPKCVLVHLAKSRQVSVFSVARDRCTSMKQ